MINRRKIKVWAVSFGLVVGVFIIICFFVQTPEIQRPGSENGGDDMVVPDLSGKSSEVAGVGIGKVSMTEFIKRDEDTGRIKEIFGFEKLLNPERKNERWKLDQPYLKSFGEDSSFKLTADKGDVRVDTIVGEATPSEGTLRGNVVITINSQQDGKSVQSFVYMDTLDYSSDRSEIATKGPIRFVSDDVILEGVGMVLIYNTGLDRIEYFKITELDYLNIYNASSLEGDPGEVTASGEESAGKVASVVGPVEKSEPVLESVAMDPVKKSTPVLKSAVLDPVEKAEVVLEPVVMDPIEKLGAVSVPAEDKSSSKLASRKPGNYYQCSFFDDVVIKRLDNLVVQGADNINIVSIFYGKSDKGKSEATSAGGKESLEEKKVAKDVAIVKEDKGIKDVEGLAVGEAVVKNENIAKDVPGLAIEESISDAASGEGSVDVAANETVVNAMEEDRVPEIVVTCRGSLVVVPMADVDETVSTDGRPVVIKLSEVAVKGKGAGGDGEDAVFAEEAGPGKTYFRSKHIDYDLTSGRGYAGGPVKFTFYSEPDPNGLDPEKLIPMIVDADDNAEYYDDAKVMTFNGNVIGQRKDVKVDHVQDNVFYGEQLAVELYQESAEAKELSVKYVSVTGEKVKLKSTRTVGEEIINQVQLFRSRINYDAINEVITAGEGGRIEINNANAPVKAAIGKGKRSLGLEKPCYAVIENFERLMWFLKGNTIIAKGEETGLTVGYIPIVDGKPGSAIQTAAKHVTARLNTSKSKRAELLTLTARDGVHYYEEDGNEFTGDNLFYDASTDMMVVSGHDGQPCFANGVETDRIVYNLGTGKWKTSLSSRPGTVSSKRRRRR